MQPPNSFKRKYKINQIMKSERKAKKFPLDLNNVNSQINNHYFYSEKKSESCSSEYKKIKNLLSKQIYYLKKISY